MTQSPLGHQTSVRVMGSVYARPFGAETVLLEFGRGEYFALDEIGTMIWKQLEGGAKLGEIAREVAREYEVTEDKALTDIITLIDELRTKALVEVVG